MRIHLLAFLLVLAATIAAGPSAPAQSRKNITYTTGPGGAERGDLYEPTGAGPFPAILYLHGGSWRSGNKGSFHRLAQDLAGQGYVGFSIDYDLAPHSFPLSWEQARAAVRFLRAHAAEYRVDPDRIAIAGTSAGGELAALVALAPEGPATPSAGAATDATSAGVSAAIILNGVFDLGSSAHVITRYLGGECSTRQAACDDASPLHHVHAGAPPFFVGHGDADAVVNFGQARAFTAALREAHVPVTPFVAPGGPHMYWEKKPYYDGNLKAVEAFLASTLQPPAQR